MKFEKKLGIRKLHNIIVVYRRKWAWHQERKLHAMLRYSIFILQLSEEMQDNGEDEYGTSVNDTYSVVDDSTVVWRYFAIYVFSVFIYDLWLWARAFMALQRRRALAGSKIQPS